eukprot:TRINITY_DN13852_c0_g1_i1.p1 TRINITY_DN13852_c0_g1~~TRINITY_DN13852_c0_g1_i1.p1  ORF type:complete len:133 (-),score=17.75 TRINITY_DN13852_c0_g1_i1:71-469(-)
MENVDKFNNLLQMITHLRATMQHIFDTYASIVQSSDVDATKGRSLLKPNLEKAIGLVRQITNSCTELNNLGLFSDINSTGEYMDLPQIRENIGNINNLQQLINANKRLKEIFEFSASTFEQELNVRSFHQSD